MFHYGPVLLARTGAVMRGSALWAGSGIQAELAYDA